MALPVLNGGPYGGDRPRDQLVDFAIFDKRTVAHVIAKDEPAVSRQTAAQAAVCSFRALEGGWTP